MSCQFHPSISDVKPASPTAVLLHLYYLHDPRLGLPRSHHTADGSLPLPPQLDSDGDESEDDEYDDEELWCAGKGLYVAYECVRVWVEADTAVRELCEHLEDIVSWPIDDMGVQVWHGDSKLHPSHTLQQLGWFRALLPATTASPPASPHDRLLLCLPADPCVCTHCCRIDYARAKRRVRLVRRHVEQHYTEVVMADDEEEEAAEARKRQGRGGAHGKGKGGKAEEDDSWMDEVAAGDAKGGKDKGGSGGKGAKGKKQKQAKDTQRQARKEREAREERERRAREQREKEEAGRQERARREAEAVAEAERVEREREEMRRLREQQKEWEEEEKRAAPPAATPKVITATAATGKKKKQQQQQALVERQQEQSSSAAAPMAPSKPPAQQLQPTQRKAKSQSVISDAISPASKRAAPEKQPPAASNTQQQQRHDAAAVDQHTVAPDSPPAQPTPTPPRKSSKDDLAHQFFLATSRRLPAPTQQPTYPNSAVTATTKPLVTPSIQPAQPAAIVAAAATTTKPVAVPVHSAALSAVQPTKWRGWSSPCATRAQPPETPPSALYGGPSAVMSPHPSIASTDDDSGSLHSDSFSLFSAASAPLPPSSPTSFRSHRLSSAASSNSASTATSPCLSALSGASLSPSLPPLFCDKSADAPLPPLLSPFTAPTPPTGAVSSRTSALWPLSQRSRWHESWDADDEAVLQAACSEYNNAYGDDTQLSKHYEPPLDEQPWSEPPGGAPLRSHNWALPKAAPTVPGYAPVDGSIYNPQYRPYREGLLLSHAGPTMTQSRYVAGGDGGGEGGGGPQLYGYMAMPLVQYVPVYISNEQAQSNEA